MKAGQLNRLITIQINTPTYDSYNQSIDAWTNSFNLWASVVTTGGGEFYAAQKVNAETSVLFKVRYTTAITTTNRIIYEGRTFAILAINNVDGMRKELQLSCKEVV